jgi:hypothetical protein
MHGETILDALRKIAEAPWGDYYGKPMNARDLARLLKPYGVSSVDVKVDGTNRKGYRREHLHDSWTRYLPPADGGSATSATWATTQASDGTPVAGSGQEALPATSDPLLTSEVAEVAQVADTPPGSGQCTICGGLLDQALIDAGLTDHGEETEAAPAYPASLKRAMRELRHELFDQEAGPVSSAP